jgi:hypothetical protein
LPTPTASARPITRAPDFDNDLALSQLAKLKDLPENWNGYGARPIDQSMVDAASHFLLGLSDDDITTPQIVPMTRGRLQFEWHRDNRSLELEFEDSEHIHYLKSDDDSGIEEEDILSTSQREEIVKLLRWFSSE